MRMPCPPENSVEMRTEGSRQDFGGLPRETFVRGGMEKWLVAFGCWRCYKYGVCKCVFDQNASAHMLLQV